MRRVRGWLAGVVLASGAAGAAGAELEATVHWGRRAVLGVPVSGVVQAVHVEPGARVKQGDALVTLDPRGFRAAVDGARARVDKATPALEEARRELERARDLYDRTLLANHELQLAEIAVASADADHRLAAAALAQARLDLEYSVLRAPFDGMVLERRVEPGETVVSRLQAVPLVVLAADAPLVARAAVGGEALRAIDLGQAATVILEGQRIAGRVVGIGETASPAGDVPGTPVAVAFTPPPGKAPPVGRRVTLELP